MNNILFTDVVIPGGDEPENVMVFTRLGAKTLAAAFRAKNAFTWADCAQVPDGDIGYYLWDALYLTRKQEREAIKLARKAEPCTS